MFALALLLAATPINDFPFDKGVRVKDHGTGTAVQANQARGIDCYGALTCSVDGGWLSITAGDAGSGGGGSGAPTTASYITRVAESGLSNETAMGALGTGLVLNATTTGTPSIYTGTSCTNQFPRSLNASGAATCNSVTLGTDTTGSYVASVSGNNGEVLYRTGSTTVGAISNFETDGTRPSVVAETTHPAAPGSARLLYDFQPSTSVPPAAWSIDSTVNLPMPAGLLRDFAQSSVGDGGTSVFWSVGCVAPATHATTSLTAFGMNTPSIIAGAGANSWATTSKYTRNRIVTFTISGGTNTSAGARESTTTQTGFWRGNASGLGGFVFFHRFAVQTGVANSRLAFGMFNTTSALTVNADPNAATNSIYMGCNVGDSNFSICSNDNTSTATCSSLGSDFPCTTSGAFYDLWFMAAPNASSVKYMVERLDAPARAEGTISSDLPQNTVQMNWHHWVNTGSQTGVVRSGFGRLCVAVNLD